MSKREREEEEVVTLYELLAELENVHDAGGLPFQSVQLVNVDLEGPENAFAMISLKDDDEEVDDYRTAVNVEFNVMVGLGDVKKFANLELEKSKIDFGQLHFAYGSALIALHEIVIGGETNKDVNVGICNFARDIRRAIDACVADVSVKCSKENYEEGLEANGDKTEASN